MGWLETNIFPITNLDALTGRYRLCRILGLDRDQKEYYQNCQHLERLSFKLRRPVLVIERQGIPYLVVPEDVATLPADYPLVRNIVQFRPTAETLELNYATRNSDTDPICLRFLGFSVQTPLYHHTALWQPRAGRPFFERIPVRREGNVDHFSGFAVRPVITPNQGMGLCVDPTTCYVGAQPLPADLSRDDFNRSCKGRWFLYHFADQWYEIRAEGLDDRTVSDYLIVQDNRRLSLLEYILEHASKPISSELANIAHDGAVILYRNNRNQQLSAPAALCYPIVDTDLVKRDHSQSIRDPSDRRETGRHFVHRYLRQLHLPGATLEVDPRPVRIPERWFSVPDVRFGHSVVLSVRNTPGARSTGLFALGRTRSELLRDPTAGFFVDRPLDRHYVLLPRSVHDSSGQQFVRDLKRAVDTLMPNGQYAPLVIPYDDQGPKTFQNQGLKILEAARQCLPGYAVVMIHQTEDRRHGKEDQLAAMIMRELRERCDLLAAIIHSDLPKRAYREEHDRNGDRIYSRDPKHHSRFSGYLRNVALNHVLINNQRWPFVLETKLNADLTIGLDVKRNTCGLVIVAENGARVRWFFKTSRQKEKLLVEQVDAYLTQLIREESATSDRPIGDIVLHQDGRAWPPHLEGAKRAIKRLKAEGTVASDADLTVLEISKSSPAPLRLFKLRPRSRDFAATENPQVGRYYISGDEAYLCTTGRAFPRPGTVRPLHVRRVLGSRPLEHSLEDLFCLTLPWTRPEDCTRHPITLKLNDRFLRAEAGEYDSDALALAELEKEEVA
jgi:hypothetical protein